MFVEKHYNTKWMSFITIITSFFTILIVKLFTRLISLEKNSKREFRYQDNVYLYTLKTFPTWKSQLFGLPGV
jgi:hypothetical protein